MKAHGLRQLLRNSMDVVTELFSEDYGHTEMLSVTSPLDPDQL